MQKHVSSPRERIPSVEYASLYFYRNAGSWRAQSDSNLLCFAIPAVPFGSEGKRCHVTEAVLPTGRQSVRAPRVSFPLVAGRPLFFPVSSYGTENMCNKQKVFCNRSVKGYRYWGERTGSTRIPSYRSANDNAGAETRVAAEKWCVNQTKLYLCFFSPKHTHYACP